VIMWQLMATYSMEEDYLPFALIGLEQRRDEIDSKIAEIRQLLGQSAGTPKAAPSAPATGKKTGKRRTMSPEARARIAEAQRARWANSKGTAKKSSGQATSGAKAPAKTKAAAKTRGAKKRTMSPEARARIAEAQRKRWAASRKEA
jgi:hypothetical protein